MGKEDPKHGMMFSFVDGLRDLRADVREMVLEIGDTELAAWAFNVDPRSIAAWKAHETRGTYRTVDVPDSIFMDAE